MEARRQWRASGLLFGIFALTGIVERLFGRSFLCRCGRLRLWTGQVFGPENSQQLADWYSLSHVVHGLLFYAGVRLAMPRSSQMARLLVATAVEAMWEMAENSPPVIARYRATTASLGYVGDSIVNSLGDIGFMLLGFALASRLPVRAAGALGVALELIALAAIRDNLTLNVLMLIHPIAAIRQWQLG